MSILMKSATGAITQASTLEEARLKSNVIEVIVTSALNSTQSNIIAAWPSTRALSVSKGGSIGNTTAFSGLPEIQPEMFGAIGDGTTNATAAFTRLALATGNGALVRFSPNATYVVDNGAYVLSGVTGVIFEGNGATVIPSTTWSGAGGTPFSFTNGSTKIFNLNLNRKTSTFTGKAMQGVSFTGGTFTVDGGTYTDCYNGIVYSNVSGWKVMNTRHIGLVAWASEAEMEAASALYQVAYIGIFGNDTTGVSTSPYGEVSGNYGDKVRTLFYGQNSDYCNVTGNKTEGADSGLYARAKDVRFINNTIINSGKDGIKNINPEGKNSITANNTISVVGKIVASGGVAINLFGDNHIAHDNIITLGSRVAGEVVSTANIGVQIIGSRANIHDNTINGPGAADGSSQGVAQSFTNYAANIDDLDIHHNKFNALQQGMQLNPSASYVLSNVKISDNKATDLSTLLYAVNPNAATQLIHIYTDDNRGNFAGNNPFVKVQNAQYAYTRRNNAIGNSTAYNWLHYVGVATGSIEDNHLSNAANQYNAYIVDSGSTGVRSGGNTYNGGTPQPITNTQMAGERVTASRASGSALSLSAITPVDVTSISLPAGDWDINGIVTYTATGATTAHFKSGGSVTSVTFGAAGTFVKLPLVYVGITDTIDQVLPTYRLSLAVPTTVYLVGQADFSAGTVTAYGTIQAVRAAQ